MTPYTLDELRESSDWREAFAYASETSAVAGYHGSVAGFTMDDVAAVLAIDDGENDGPHWLGVFRLTDGRFAFLSAGCDYTGWDCQAGGDAVVAGALEQLVQFGLGQQDRWRLGYEARPESTDGDA